MTKRIKPLRFNIMNWNKEDIELVEKFIQIRNKGYYADGTQLTEVYNRVLDKRVNPTNCGSCIRQRINELEEALNRFRNVSSLHSNPLGVSKRLSEAQAKQEVDNVPQEENNAVRKAGKSKK